VFFFHFLNEMGLLSQLVGKGNVLHACIPSVRLAEDDSLLFQHGLRIFTNFCTLTKEICQMNGLEGFLGRVRSAESLMAFLDPIYTIRELFSLVSMMGIALHCEKIMNMCIYSISWKTDRYERRVALKNGKTLRDTAIQLAYYSSRLIAEALSSAMFLFEKGLDSAIGRWQKLISLVSQILALLLHVLRRIQSKTVVGQSICPPNIFLWGSKQYRHSPAPMKSSVAQILSFPLMRHVCEVYSSAAEIYRKENPSWVYASVITLAKIGGDLLSVYLLRQS